MRIADEAPLCLIAITRGTAWLLLEDGEALRLGPGDVVVIRGPDPYTLADDPRTEPQVIILPGNRCVTPGGQEVELMSWMGVRTWGNSPVGSVVMLSGTYELEGEVSRRLLNALPPLLVLPSDEWESPLVGLLADEIVKDDPGQEAVLDRLLDLLLIAVLRAWFARPDAHAPGWYRAYSDPVVGKALRLIHDDPARQWTVADLAAEAGVSRAAFARRFTELVGEPPMAFITDWRLSLAADLLLEPEATIGSVAYQVGYATPYALSTAFKRVRGVSPRQHRLAAVAT
jgi:AraC-like DNA-binding protein